MSFRLRQKLHAAPFCRVTEMRDKILETGEVVHECEDLSKTKLPNPELFDLKNQLKAGVNLEEVNSKVFSSSRIAGDAVAKIVGIETKPKDESKKEVNNEN